MYVNLSRLTRAERTGSRIGVVSSGPPACIPVPTVLVDEKLCFSGQQWRRSSLRTFVFASPRECQPLRIEMGRPPTAPYIPVAKTKLPRNHRALQGWRRRTPPRAERCVWATLISEFLRHRHWSMGIYLLWTVTCYFRPGERLTILRGDSHFSHAGKSAPDSECFFTKKTDH